MTLFSAGMRMRQAGAHNMVVLTSAAGDHRRRSEALHRQSDCQQGDQSETKKPLHVQSLSDRRRTRTTMPMCFGKKPAWHAHTTSVDGFD